MLLSLNINNILIIDKIKAEFSERLNVITGETGSGKSVILESLLLALGERNLNLAPQNNEKGIITAAFDISKNKKVKELLKENDIDHEGEIIIKRSISESRSVSYVNDVQVTVNLLKKISDDLIEVYGQHDFSSLLTKKAGVEIIDEYANNSENLKELFKHYSNIKNLEKAKQQLIAEYEKNVKDKEYFESAIDEIGKLDIQENEEEALSDKLNLIKKSGKVLEIIAGSLSFLQDGNYSHSILQQIRALGRVANELDENSKQKLDEAINHLDKASEGLSEAENLLETILDETNFSERQKQEMEDRLYSIKEICRKYRVSSNELVKFNDDLKQKLKSINNSDSEIKKIEKEIEQENKKYSELAKLISDKRKKASKEIETKVNKEFPELKMPGAKFNIAFTVKNEISPNGHDDVEFLIATNPNQPLAALGKVASGGEISRVMLALKIALSEKVGGASLIFDEIDTGISGSTAEAVGKRLKALSAKTQTIVITHQPQVASKADKHFMVQKITSKNSSEITLRELSQAESNKEVARIISGEDITNEAIAQAKKLKN